MYNKKIVGLGGVKSIKFKDLVGKRFDIEVGSGMRGKIWDKDSLTKEIERAIKHNLFDMDFYYNYTNDGKKYEEVFKKDTLKPLLKNIDKTLNNMFSFKNDELTFNIEGRDARKWIDKWFQTNKSITNSLKQDYYTHRKEYAGVILK